MKTATPPKGVTARWASRRITRSPESRALISRGTSLSEMFASTPLYRKHLRAKYSSASEFRIIPSDRLPEPRPEDVPTLAEALKEAASHRPEIEQVELNLLNQQVVIQSIHNSLLPSLDAYASYYLAGLDGALRSTFTNIFHDDFPNFSYG